MDSSWIEAFHFVERLLGIFDSWTEMNAQNVTSELVGSSAEETDAVPLRGFVLCLVLSFLSR